MTSPQKKYFCYIDQDGEPRIVEKEPEHFDLLRYSRELTAPNRRIAEMTYACDLKQIEIRR